ncbi:hypothetical protein Syun_019409 [Stephania yunnanensis]|uniref:Uncharacterized protein n=1 Tax=Stephania yunnanensis TaxID=152371 RepID=A0AAP0NVW5_9MAGN
MSSLTFTRMSSKTPTGRTTDRSAKCMIIPVSFRGPAFNVSYMDSGMTLIEAPRSHMAFWISTSPIVQGTVNMPGPHTWWATLRRIGETFSLR